MRKIGITACGVLLACTTGAQGQALVAQPVSPPPAGAYYGSASAPAGPAASAWYGTPTAQRPHADRTGYHAYDRGAQMGAIWRDPAYAVNDWRAWGLGQPGTGMHWLRYYDDAVLVDGYGRVVDARHGVDWDGARAGGYAGYAAVAPASPIPVAVPGYAGPGQTTVTHVGPNTTVTTQVIGGGPAYAGGAIAVGAGTLIITPGSVITTTTTTSEAVYRGASRKRVYHRPVHYRPRCVQAPTCPVQGS